MSDTFSGGQRSIQPQFQGAAPRAANPGMGAGPRPYAAGATQQYRQPQAPLARDVAAPAPGMMTPPTDSAPPTGSPGDMSGPPMTGVDPMAQANYAQSFAMRLVNMLYQRNQMRQSG